MKVHIVFYAGPEWNDPMRAFSDKRDADTYAELMNKGRSKGIYDLVSKYVVHSMNVSERRTERRAKDV